MFVGGVFIKHYNCVQWKSKLGRSIQESEGWREIGEHGRIAAESGLGGCTSVMLCPHSSGYEISDERANLETWVQKNAGTERILWDGV